MVPVTALQAILRSQVELAMNGNFRAQRYVFERVRYLEILKATGFYGETDDDELDEVGGSDEEDDSGEGDEEDETDEAGESDEEDDSDDVDETGESGEEDEADEVCESAEEDEAGQGGETGSDHTGTVVTAAADPLPPPQSGAAPPVFSAAPARPAAPKAPLPVDSALPRPAAPPRGRRTPARAPSRGGRRRAVNVKPATGGAPAARKPGRIPRENSGSAESRKIRC